MRAPQRNIVWAWHISKLYLIRTVHTIVCSSSQLSAKQCLLQQYLLREHPLHIQQHSPGCCPSTLLHEKTIVDVSKIFVQIRQLKIREIKEPRKFSAIWYTTVDMNLCVSPDLLLKLWCNSSEKLATNILWNKPVQSDLLQLCLLLLLPLLLFQPGTHQPPSTCVHVCQWGPHKLT